MAGEPFATIPQVMHDTGVRLDAPHATLWEARATAAVLDLIQKTSQAEDLHTACRTLANELQQYLGLRQVAVGLRRRGQGRCRLAAVSGLPAIDAQSEMSRRLEAAMDSAVLQTGLIAPPIAGPTPASDSAISRNEVDPSGKSLSIPLRTADGAIVGAWTCIGSPQSIDSEANRRFLDLAATSVAGTLQLLERAQGGLARQAVRRVARAAPKARGRPILAGAAIMAATMFVPVPYDLGVQCELQPNVRRFVAAPHAGEFQKSLVKPGDIVVKGQVLARMEGRELRWELAGLTAEEEHARKSRDVNMAAGKTAAAQIDHLEIQRLEVKRQLLERRLANLEIKSPVDGIVVAGDLQRSEGVQVNIGQVLYEVAPLSQMTAELAIPDEDISAASLGMPVTVRLDSLPERRWTGDLARIHPRSVTREKDNVFMGEIPLDNADGAVRPGMEGRATIRTGSRSLGWVLFHRPWNYVTVWLDW
jgi:biotin carboxyl carrier protein